MEARAMRAVFVLLSVVGLSGCSVTHGPSPAPTTQLLAASTAAGVQVHREEIFSLSRGTEAVSVAPIAGWESIPATALPNGVDFAFGYFDTREINIPAGYYRLRAFANPTAPGTVTGRVQFINRAGAVVAEVPAEIEVHTMTVPPEAASQRSFVAAVLDRQHQQGGWFRCPNGTCVRVIFMGPRILPTDRRPA